MKWWQRFSDAMADRGVSPDDVATATNIPVKSVYGYMRGAVESPRGDIVRRLASAVGMSEQELRYGDTSKNVVQLARIPLLTMNKLGTLTLGMSVSTVWDGVSMVSVPSGSVAGDAFGVTLDDDSGAPEFAMGEIVICEPSAAVAPGKMVVASVHNRRAGVFRRYRPNSHFDGKSFTLVAPNPDFPSIDVDDANPGHVIARATKHIRNI